MGSNESRMREIEMALKRIEAKINKLESDISYNTFLIEKLKREIE